MKKIDAIWFSVGEHCIGIVIGEDELTKERKAYIGVGHGVDEAYDSEAILNYGTPVSASTLDHICSILRRK